MEESEVIEPSLWDSLCIGYKASLWMPKSEVEKINFDN